MPVHSILFEDGDASADVGGRAEPRFFVDLNLDQIVASVTAGRDEYVLAPFFHLPLSEIDAVSYRQEVFEDLERSEVRELVAAFAHHKLVASYTRWTDEMSRDRPDNGHYHRSRGFLNAAEQYCQAVTALARGLAGNSVRSRGLARLRDYLEDYIGSTAFTALREEIRHLETELDAVNYCIVVKGNRVTVGHCSDEVAYSEQVTQTFERFQQGAERSDGKVAPDWKESDFTELGVLDLVSKLFPDLFAALDDLCRRHADYLDATVARVDREFEFYFSYMDYIEPLRQAGLELCYPRMSIESKQEQAMATFDLALAAQLLNQGGRVVCNDLTLSGPERILVISGPNNGGKTTLARTFGQLHYLARLGCPVPGREVRLFLCDQIYTHFEKQEDITTFAGKLQEELNRLHADLDRATPASVVILNEMFNSTTADDAQFLSRKILEQVSDLDALGVCVTFLDDLSTLNEKTVSMVSTVVPEDPATRTHKVIRTPADGRAYAHAIAEQYGLTYDRILAGHNTSRSTL